MDHESEEWTELMDRGGLKHISDTMFDFFCSLEVVFQSNVYSESAGEKESMRGMLLKKMVEDEDVLMCWSFVAVNWQEDESVALMNLMIDHWITLRGFGYVSAFVEEYKKRSKKAVQKSKGLRKKLNASDKECHYKS